MSNSCQDFASSARLKALEDKIKALENEQKRIEPQLAQIALLGAVVAQQRAKLTVIEGGLSSVNTKLNATNSTLANFSKNLNIINLILGVAGVGAGITANFKANNLVNRANTNDSRVSQLEAEIFRLLNLLSLTRRQQSNSGATADQALREARGAKSLAQQALSLAQSALNQLARLEALINGIRAQLQAQISAILARLANVGSEISSILARLANVEGAVSALRGAIDSLRSALNQLNNLLVNAVNSINARIDTINQRIDNVNQSINNRFNNFINFVNSQINNLFSNLTVNNTQQINNVENQVKQKDKVDNKKLDDIKKDLERLLRRSDRPPEPPNRDREIKRAITPLFNAQTQQITNAIKESSCCDITSSIDQRTKNLDDKIGDSGSTANSLTLFGAFKAFIASNAFDKALNVANFIMNTHNAIMLSRDLLETLGDVASNILGVIGIKDANGNAIDVTEQLGTSITNLITSVIGTERYSALQVKLAALNRIYQATANVIDTINDMVDSTRHIAETTGNYTGKIGNALREAGVVYENAYEAMEENFEQIRTPNARFQKFIDGLEQTEDTANSISSVFSEVRSIQDGINEIQEERTAFNTSLETLTNERKEEKEEIKNNSVSGSESFDNVNVERLGQ